MSQYVQQSTKQKQPRKACSCQDRAVAPRKQSLKVCIGDGGESLQDQSHVAAAAAKSLQSCSTLCDPIDGSPLGSSVPGILQTRITGVGCHFLLQCMKVKSESEVAQSSPTLSDPMDCSLPGSSIHGIFQARVLEWGAIAFSKRVFSWE